MSPPAEYPRVLTAFGFTGLKLTASKQWFGDCPFCGKAQDFYLKAGDNLLWDCKVCGRAGGFGRLLGEMAMLAQRTMTPAQLQALARNRGLQPETLRRAGVGCLHGRLYTVPIWSWAGTGEGCVDLRRWTFVQPRLLSAPGARAGLWGGQNLKASEKDPVYIMEGEWDGMAMEETLRTQSAQGSIVARPGASVFSAGWPPLFVGRDCIVCNDNDAAGRRGDERVRVMLEGVARRVRFVEWPEGTADKYDYRDLLLAQGHAAALAAVTATLVEPKGAVTTTGVAASVETAAPLTWPQTLEAYRKWLELASDEVLLVLFGVLVANQLPGDPLWLFLVAPPGGCKSELLMSLSGVPTVYAMTSLTPHALISGAQGPGGTDPSLLPLLDGKVLVIKDFTAILSMPGLQRDEILGILRDAYDGTASKPFGTGIRRQYKSRFGILAGVTPIIEQYASQHTLLGERFLRYCIRLPGIVNVGQREITRALDNLTAEPALRAELSQAASGFWTAMNGRPAVDPHAATQGAVIDLVALAQAIAALRGSVTHERYTADVLYRPTAEIGTRLAKQFAKLALGIAAVRQESTISLSTWRIVRRVARDTIPDRTEAVVRALSLHAKATEEEIMTSTHLPKGTIALALEDLILQRLVGRTAKTKPIQYSLSASIRSLLQRSKLYEEERSWHTQNGPLPPAAGKRKESR